MKQPISTVEALESRRLMVTYGVDPTFGDGASAPAYGNAQMVVLPNGHVIAGGAVRLPDRHFDDINMDSGVTELDAEGNVVRTFDDPDMAFNSAVSPLFAANASRVYIRGDGSLTGDDEIHALRVSDGAFDPTFSGDGVLPFTGYTHSPVGGQLSLAGGPSLDLLPDGSLLVNSQFIVNSQLFRQIAKLKPDGTLDTGFADGGFLTFSAGQNLVSGLNEQAVVVGANRFLVLGGGARLYKFDGSLDTSFGTNGVRQLPVHEEQLAFQNDGKILFTNDSSVSNGGQLRLYRLNTNGTDDTSFGDGGNILVPPATTSGVNEPVGSIVVDSQGRIVLGGASIWRYSDAGVLDADLNGTVGRRDGSRFEAGKIAIAADGAFLLGGAEVIRVAPLEAGVVLGSNGTLYVTGGDGNDDVLLAGTDEGAKVSIRLNGQPSLFDTEAVRQIDVVLLGGNDRCDLTGFGAFSAAVRTGDGSDTIFTADGADLIDAGAGDDSVHAGGGSDAVFGGDGTDRLFGDDGFDSVYGNGGNDRIEGGAQGDFVRGNAGHDRIWGNGGNDRLYGGESGDRIYGQSGNDRMFGEGGNDRLYGDDEPGFVDSLYGGAGNDVFITVDGVIDHLFGDGGDDTANADEFDVLTSILTT